MNAEENPRRSRTGEQELPSPAPMAPLYAGASRSTPSHGATSGPASSYTKCVMLLDWWLVEAKTECDGKRLAITGFTTRKQAMRIFTSAPIIKRYNAFTLGTADGVTVIIQGMINKTRMLENGFSPKVCSCFHIGFPLNWDSYATDYFRETSTSNSVPASCCGASKTVEGTAHSSSPARLVDMNELQIDSLVNSLGSTHMNNLIITAKKIFKSLLPITVERPSCVPNETMDLSESRADVNGNGNCNLSANDQNTPPIVNNMCEGHAIGHGEVEHNNMELSMGDTMEECFDIDKYLSPEYLLQENENACSKTDRSRQVEKEALLSNARAEKERKLIETALDSQNADDKSHHVEEKLATECITSFTDPAPNEADLFHFKHLREAGSGALGNKHSDARICTSYASSNYLAKNDSGGVAAGASLNAADVNLRTVLDSDNKISHNILPRSAGPVTRSRLHLVKKSRGSVKGKQRIVIENKVSQPRALVEEKSSRNDVLHTPTSLVLESPVTRQRAKQLSLTIPESLKLKRSRAGRLIVPPLDRGSQQIIYDASGFIAGIAGLCGLLSPCRGTMSEPPKKKKKLHA